MTSRLSKRVRVRVHPICGRAGCGHDRQLHGGDKHGGMCVGPDGQACGCRRFLPRRIAAGPGIAPVFDFMAAYYRRGTGMAGWRDRWGGSSPW